MCVEIKVEDLADVCNVCGYKPNESCKQCDGYGYLPTGNGRAVIAFLAQMGFTRPMSPRAEAELAEKISGDF